MPSFTRTINNAARKAGPLLLCAIIATLFIGVTIHYIRKERFFYFWDNFAYHRATLESLSALQQPGMAWLTHLRISMQSGFSQLFTVTLAPLMAGLGEGRTVFITGIIGFYLLPCAALCTLIVNRIIPLQRWQWPLVFTTCVTLPVLWRASLAGYPDIGGIMIALGAILMITGDPGYKKWTTAAGLGVVLTLTFLFRRHLVYLIIPLMGVTSCFALFHCYRERSERVWLPAGWTIVRLAFTTALTISLIWVVAPNYFHELISTNFRELYLPFQYPIDATWRQHRDYVGVLYWILGLFGLGWGMFAPGAKKWVSALLLGYLILSVYIWVFYLRYLSVQYNLHFAVIIAIGTGVLVALCGQKSSRNLFSLLLATILMLLWLDRLALFPFIPVAVGKVLPARLPSLNNPDYAEIERLITVLRTHAVPPHNNVLVVASSQLINSDMLTIGEGALFGRTHRQMAIMNGSHADTVQPYPLRDMITADWLIVASPFQHHLRIEDQGVVLVAYEAMKSATPYARDFEKKTSGFELQGGVKLEIYRRLTPTPFATQVDTARRVFDTVGVADAWTGPFMVGEAATGAEYYDARLIVPSSPGKYTADFEQVRLRPGQSSITLFTLVDGTREQQISALLGGSAESDAELLANFFPNSGESAPTNWSWRVSVPYGRTFQVPVPYGGKGILTLQLTPGKLPTSGAPLGVILRDLTIEQK